MQTFANRQFDELQAQLDTATEAQALKISAALDALDRYQPCDFQPGESWDNLFTMWQSAPITTCRSIAITALVDIANALMEIQ